VISWRAGAVALVLPVLVGCGGADVSRSADAETEAIAEAETAVIAEVDAAPAADAGTEAEIVADADVSSDAAGALPPINSGTKICITNNSSLEVTTKFTLAKNSDGNKTLSRGDSACGQGQQNSGNDVEVELRLPIRHSYRIDGNRPLLPGPPIGRISQLYNYYCTSDSGVERGETRSWDDGVVKISLTTTEATGLTYAEFNATVEDSANPSESNKQTRC
jgi:hypothetical protein